MNKRGRNVYGNGEVYGVTDIAEVENMVVTVLEKESVETSMKIFLADEVFFEFVLPVGKEREWLAIVGVG